MLNKVEAFPVWGRTAALANAANIWRVREISVQGCKSQTGSVGRCWICTSAELRHFWYLEFGQSDMLNFNSGSYRRYDCGRTGIHLNRSMQRDINTYPWPQLLRFSNLAVFNITELLSSRSIGDWVNGFVILKNFDPTALALVILSCVYLLN